MRIPWIYVNPKITLMMSLKWKRRPRRINRDRARQYENTEIIITRGHRIYSGMHVLLEGYFVMIKQHPASDFSFKDVQV